MQLPVCRKCDIAYTANRNYWCRIRYAKGQVSEIVKHKLG